MFDIERNYSFECPTCKARVYFPVDTPTRRACCTRCGNACSIPEQARTEAELFAAISAKYAEISI